MRTLKSHFSHRYICESMTKQTKTITLNKGLLEWIEEMIEKKEFGSISHAIEKALTKMRNEYERKTP